MFNKSKYTNWYYYTIRKAKRQQRSKGKGIYYEKHHIIPKSLSGSNNQDNLVLLTPKEHYICHLLLPKMCINSKHKGKMVYAFMMLSGKRNKYSHNYNSNLYDKFKKSYCLSISGENSYMYGVPKTDETKKKISDTRIKEGTSVGEKNGMFGKKHSVDSKRAMANNSKGKTAGMKNGMFGKKRPDLTQRNIENNIRYEIGQYDNNMNLIAVYPSAAVAAEAIKAKTFRNISYLAKNYLKYPNRTAYGFKWKYHI